MLSISLVIDCSCDHSHFNKVCDEIPGHSRRHSISPDPSLPPRACAYIWVETRQANVYGAPFVSKPTFWKIFTKGVIFSKYRSSRDSHWSRPCSPRRYLLNMDSIIYSHLHEGHLGPCRYLANIEIIEHTGTPTHESIFSKHRLRAHVAQVNI